MMKLIEPNLYTALAAGGQPSKPVLRRYRLRNLFIGSAVLAALAGIAARELWSTSSITPSASAAEARISEVQTVHPVRQTLTKIIEQPGTVDGFEQTALYTKLPGFIREWRKDLGDRVNEGDILAELSVPEEQEELLRRRAAAELALAEITAAERALDAAKADEVKAEAQIRQAHATRNRYEANVAHWKAEFPRLDRLRKKDAASQSDSDAALDSLRSAEAGLKDAEAGIDSASAAKESAIANRIKAEAGVAVAKAKFAVSEADARKQAEWLKYATIKAPFNGVITQRKAERQQYVTPPSTGVPQPPLFVVVRTDPVRIFVDIPEAESPYIHVGMPVTVRLQALKDREIPAVVTRYSGALDTNSRAMRVQIDLPNPQGEYMPGMFAVARFELKRTESWLVPAGVVSTMEEQQYVVRVEDGKLYKTPVKVGLRQGGMVELIHKHVRVVPKGEPYPWEGLTGSEEFLLTRPSGWTEGMSVTSLAK